jgi:hypothetical protein
MTLTYWGISLVLIIGIALIVLALIAFLISLLPSVSLGKQARKQIAAAFFLGVLFVILNFATVP